MNILGLISQLIGIKTLRLTKGIITTNIHKYIAINLDLQIIAINSSKHINKAITRTIYGLREHK